MKLFPPIILVLAIVLLSSTTIIAGELKVCDDLPGLATDASREIAPPANTKGSDALWVGTIRVYLVEPVSRWVDDIGYEFENALIDFPLVNNVNLEDGTMRYLTAQWNVSEAPYFQPQTIFEDNIMAIGVAFNVQEVPTPASPPSGDWFNARYADASALATPGYPGRNETTGGFTHTVFIEESTANF
jgi:hypothetical protein